MQETVPAFPHHRSNVRRLIRPDRAQLAARRRTMRMRNIWLTARHGPTTKSWANPEFRVQHSSKQLSTDHLQLSEILTRCWPQFWLPCEFSRGYSWFWIILAQRFMTCIFVLYIFNL